MFISYFETTGWLTFYFNILSSLNFQVLKVQADKKKIALTHKKTLLNSDLPIITSYSDVKVGSVIHGYAINVQSYGVVLGFYNDVRALMPKSQIL